MGSDLQCIRYGPNGILVQFADSVSDSTYARGQQLVAFLESRPPPGLQEYVPAFTSLLLEYAPGANSDDLLTTEEFLDAFRESPVEPKAPPAVKSIPVVYDGCDLAEVADLHGMTVRELIQIHSQPTYRVHMLGFSPGFPYLSGLPACIHTPRRATPRTRIPVGAVGIGGEHTGIYTTESPGGWNILGTTPLRIYDPARTRNGTEDGIFFLRPGDLLRFVPV